MGHHDLHIIIIEARKISNEAMNYYESGNYSEAIDSFKTVLELLKDIPLDRPILGDKQSKVFEIIRLCWIWMGYAYGEIGSESNKQFCLNQEKIYNEIFSETSQKRAQIMTQKKKDTQTVIIYGLLFLIVLGSFHFIPAINTGVSNLIVMTMILVTYFYLYATKYRYQKLLEYYRDKLAPLNTESKKFSINMSLSFLIIISSFYFYFIKVILTTGFSLYDLIIPISFVILVVLFSSIQILINPLPWDDFEQET